MILADVVKILVEIGRSGDSDKPAIAARLESFGRYDSINSKRLITWRMPTNDLAALTKGLVLAERHHSWIGGSGASAIWTFRELQRRDSELADKVANWILPRTQNPWFHTVGRITAHALLRSTAT